MSKLILIETSTALCSVSLVEDGKICASRLSETPRAQASLTAVFVDEVLREAGIRVSGCDAVCVSSGPGSYTGLRVGVSTAKGLCFASGKPLIGVCTLDILAAQAADNGLIPEGCKYIVPMVDARRMEVYTAVYSPDGTRLSEIEARIIDAGSFSKELEEGPVLFIGDGAEKCAGTITSPNAHFAAAFPTADGMLRPALKAFSEGKFEDTAYFEPFYLKQFVATVSKKNLF